MSQLPPPPQSPNPPGPEDPVGSASDSHSAKNTTNATSASSNSPPDSLPLPAASSAAAAAAGAQASGRPSPQMPPSARIKPSAVQPITDQDEEQFSLNNSANSSNVSAEQQQEQGQGPQLSTLSLVVRADPAPAAAAAAANNNNNNNSSSSSSNAEGGIHSHKGSAKTETAATAAAAKEDGDKKSGKGKDGRDGKDAKDGKKKAGKRRIIINNAPANKPLTVSELRHFAHSQPAAHGHPHADGGCSPSQLTPEQEQEQRELHRGGDGSGKAFASNFIKTSKYRWWDFLPLNLFEQFRRIANLYFLIIVIIQLIPGVSPFPIYSSLIPLLIILAVTAIKEAKEDWNRHRADHAANARTYLVLRTRSTVCKALLDRAERNGVTGVTEADVLARLPKPDYALVESAHSHSAHGHGHAKDGSVATVAAAGLPTVTMVDGSNNNNNNNNVESDPDAVVLGNNHKQSNNNNNNNSNDCSGNVDAAAAASERRSRLGVALGLGAFAHRGGGGGHHSTSGVNTGAAGRRASFTRTVSRLSSKGGGGSAGGSVTAAVPARAVTGGAGSTREAGVQWWDRVASANLRVGDIVRILDGEEFPADLALLSSSSADGLAFVNTANLDGEAVPKPKSSPAATLALHQPMGLVHLQGAVTAEPPSSNMHEWKGALALAPNSGESIDSNNNANAVVVAGAAGGAIVPELPATAVSAHTDGAGRYMHSLSHKQLLLRGSSLANTAFVNAVVVYTGGETKMMLNRNLAQFKFSRFERKLNTFIIIIMVINLIFCLLMPSISLVVNSKFEHVMDIYEGGFVGWLLSFFTHYVLYSWMVPISLYVTIELVKVGQAQFMEWDEGFLWKDPDMPPSTKPKAMRVNTSALNEELGMIDYVFSDKTGTLTQNKMELAYVSVAGTLFQDVPDRLNNKDGANGNDDKNKNNNSNKSAVDGESKGANADGAADAEGHNLSGSASNLSLSTPGMPTVNALADVIIKAMPFAFHANSNNSSNKSSAFAAASPVSSSAPEPLSPVHCRPTRATTHPTQAVAPPPAVSAAWEALQPDETALVAAAAAEGFRANRVRERQLLFAYNMLLNNGVQPVLDAETGQWQFQSQSPDEIALCEAFYRAGLMLFRRLGDHLELLCTSYSEDDNGGDANSNDVKKSPLNANINNNNNNNTAGSSSASVFKQPGADEDYGALSSGYIPGTEGLGIQQGGYTSGSGGGVTSRPPDVLDVEVNVNGGGSSSAGGLGDAAAGSGLGAHTAEASATVAVPAAAVLTFSVLASLEFSSARRRSDLVVRCDATDAIYLLIKGADSTVLPMCDSESAEGAALLARAEQQAATFAATGSRTLVLAGRVMAAAEFDDWFAVYSAANTSLGDREAAQEAAFAKLERGLDLLGISAVNDQMQERVPETVDALLAAGVKVVVLTGDKRETAETISAECHILQEHMTRLYVTATPTEEEHAQRLERYIAQNPDALALQQQALAAMASPIGPVTGSPVLSPAAAGAAVPAIVLPPEEEAELRADVCRRSLTACLAFIEAAGKPSQSIRTRVSRPSDAGDDEAIDLPLSPAPASANDANNNNNNANAGANASSLRSGSNAADEAGIEMATLNKSKNKQVSQSNNSDDAASESGETTKPLVFVAILSGNTLETALTHCKEEFLRFFLACATIVTYRSAPKQKALVVQLVKRELGHTCLAIGDGANDVSMIQEAHVGIGILGKEGSHAAMSADYVVHRFAHLQRLLFVHGRYNLNRTSKVVMLSLWKNFVFVLPVVWFAFSDNYSGQIVASSYFMSLYNLAFTSLQPLSIGIFDRDAHERLLLRAPLAYKYNKLETRYTVPELLRWLTVATIQSVLVYAFTFYSAMRPEIDAGSGKTFDLFSIGNMQCWAVIVLVNCVMLAECDVISWISVLVWAIGIALFIAVYMFLSLVFFSSFSPDTYGLLQFSYNSTLLWLVFLLAVMAMFVVWAVWRSYYRFFAPYYYQKLQAWALALPAIAEPAPLPPALAKALMDGDLDKPRAPAHAHGHHKKGKEGAH